MKIYLAGPLFTAAELAFNAALAGLLRAAGHEIWLPQESEQRAMTPAQIFAKDVEGIDWAEIVVANMDGPDPDSGTAWECGYAYGKKPVVLFRTDFRTSCKQRDPDGGGEAAPYNLMLTASATRRLDLPYAAVDAVAAALHRELEALSAGS
jgi:nucleoside 2-deoxyribosyltransferase